MKQVQGGKVAFTLAEVLITLGIIGVVAALTMPTLIENHKVKTTVVKLKKMNSILSQAYEMYLRENESMWIDYNQEGAVKVFKIFEPYLKVAKDCGTLNGGGCVYTGFYLNKKGQVHINYARSREYYSVLLADGSSLIFRGGSDVNKNIYLIIFYDINGEKGPNKWGYDLFEFFVNKNGLYPTGAPTNTYTGGDFDSSCIQGTGYGCAAWVIYNENMDYLHCDDLTWNGKQKCK